MQVGPCLALIISALTLGGCETETPTSPQTASISASAVKTIGVSPTGLTFYYCPSRHKPIPQTLKISNLGSRTLAWTAISSPWLKLSSSSGLTPSSVIVSFQPGGINPPLGFFGYHPRSLSGGIRVSATGATNTPLSVPVTLYIRCFY